MYAVDLDDAVPRPIGLVYGPESPATVQETPSPPGRIGYERKGMILHAAQHAMNTSRNAFARDILLDLIDECPTLAKAHAFLGSVYGRMGDPEASIALLERAVGMAPEDVSIHSTLIFALDQSAKTTMERAYRARRAFNDVVKIGPDLIAPHENDRDPDRPLRVGYVSADFRNHSAAYGWGPVLLAHARRQFDLYAYACNIEEDARTQDFQRVVPNWRDAATWDDDRLERQIREDRIDVLVDLSGHSAGNRLGVFARKPAPVQITMIGYITGTGLDAMDYIFADDVTIRPEEERWYAEEVVRLPRTLTYWVPDVSVVGDVVAPPFDENGHLTFGVFNRLGKIQPPCTRAWAEILLRLPDARLVVKAPGLDDADARVALERMFAESGAPLERLEFRGMTDQNDHMRNYHRIDVALDCSPHGGGMSTLDAAWMGVPTLTLPDKQIPSRIATTVARELGLGYLVADSWADYINRAVALDEQRDELRRVRRLMRDMFTVSAFGDHYTFARAVEAQYRTMWQRWCSGDAPRKPRLLETVA
jgi:predicted O-linked N-acetylglucosamine transferase (SPINDLY family)